MKRTENNTEEIRLNKFLSDAGFCSRRQADRLIEEGHVKVNNETALI
ncbi:MAG: S4 domain-containing protein [Eubacterium sp.]